MYRTTSPVASGVLLEQLPADEIRRMELAKAGLHAASTPPADGSTRLTAAQQQAQDRAAAATEPTAPVRRTSWVDEMAEATRRRLAAQRRALPAPSDLPHAGTADERTRPVQTKNVAPAPGGDIKHGVQSGRGVA